MTITLPVTDDPDTLGHALYDGLCACGLPDLACECAYVVRAARDVALAWERVLELTADAGIAFVWKT